MIQHRGGRGLVSEYQLLFDGDPEGAGPHLPGLIDTAKLQPYDGKWSGPEAEWSGGGRPQVGPGSGAGRGAENGASPKAPEGLASTTSAEAENARSGVTNSNGSSHSYLKPAEDIASALHSATEKS